MTAYIANHEKKQRIFEKREGELVRAIKLGRSEDELALAAEILRAAKISVFKCRFVAGSPVQPRQFEVEEVAARKPELARWLTMTAEEIVAMYH